MELKRNNVSDSKQLNKVMQKRGSGLLKPICMEVIYLELRQTGEKSTVSSRDCNGRRRVK